MLFGFGGCSLLDRKRVCAVLPSRCGGRVHALQRELHYLSRPCRRAGTPQPTLPGSLHTSGRCANSTPSRRDAAMPYTAKLYLKRRGTAQAVIESTERDHVWLRT